MLGWQQRREVAWHVGSGITATAIGDTCAGALVR